MQILPKYFLPINQSLVFKERLLNHLTDVKCSACTVSLALLRYVQYLIALYTDRVMYVPLHYWLVSICIRSNSRLTYLSFPLFAVSLTSIGIHYNGSKFVGQQKLCIQGSEYWFIEKMTVFSNPHPRLDF